MNEDKNRTGVITVIKEFKKYFKKAIEDPSNKVSYEGDKIIIEKPLDEKTLETLREFEKEEEENPLVKIFGDKNITKFWRAPHEQKKKIAKELFKKTTKDQRKELAQRAIDEFKAIIIGTDLYIEELIDEQEEMKSNMLMNYYGEWEITDYLDEFKPLWVEWEKEEDEEAWKNLTITYRESYYSKDT